MASVRSRGLLKEIRAWARPTRPPADRAASSTLVPSSSQTGGGPTRNNFHLHLMSDATGETLMAVSRAVVAQYPGVSAMEHIYPLVRTRDQLDRAIGEIERAPGIVLYTLVDQELIARLEAACQQAGAPTLSVLGPILDFFHGYLGMDVTARPGAQYLLNSDYFRRIDALNYSMAHDDGQNVEEYEDADIVLLGVSRTSKTPTSIYLANRGYKTANLPMVLRVEVPASIRFLVKPLVVGLLATPDRIVPGASLADPEPRQRPAGLCRQEAGDGGDQQLASSVRTSGMADDRREPSLDRGDGGRHHGPAARAST